MLNSLETMDNLMTSIAQKVNPVFSLPPCNILDVTLRDGGFTTNFDWNPTFVLSLAKTIYLCGIKNFEIGYLGGIPDEFRASTSGIGADIPCELIESVKAHFPYLNIFGMIHPEALNRNLDFKHYKTAGLHGVRVVYIHQRSEEPHRQIAQAKEAGLRVSLNVACITQYQLEQLVQKVQTLLSLEPDMLYFADTCSALSPAKTTEMIQLLRSVTPATIELGFHGHDFLSLGLANAIAALEAGASWVDSSVSGIGRGAGNVKTEHLVAIRSVDSHHPAPISVPALLQTMSDLVEMGVKSTNDLLSVFIGAANIDPADEMHLRQLIDQSHTSPNECAIKLFDQHNRFVE